MLDLSVVLLTFGLAAALVNPAPPAAPQPTPPVAQTEVRINQVIAPKPLKATQPAALLDGEQAAKTDINYTPRSDEQTWYFDAQGNPADQASAGGYYRKSLGKTADGRLVVQDYYQDSGKPQTAPFILKEDYDPHDFNGESSDSKTVWYRKDGSLDAIQDYRDGKPFGRLNIYDDGRLVAQFARDDEQTEDPADPYNQLDIAKGIRLYYPSGNIMAFIDYEDDERAELYYREDGSPFLATLLDSDGKIKEITSWDKNGGYLAEGPDDSELDAIDSRRKALLTRIANLEFMGDTSAESALPTPAAQPALLPESVLDAKQASKISIDYTAESDGKTWYFDRDSKPTDKASAGGYYRKSLGHTADGRLVAQDYYQDSNTPQTAPFILMKDADPSDFSTETVDSKIVWYKEDGSVSSIVPMRGGKPQGRQHYYQNGRLIAQSALPDGVEEDKDDPYGKLANDVRYYHENGHILYLQGESAIEPPYHIIIYDPAGTPLAGLYLGKNPDDVEVEHFSDTKEAQDALHAALERRKAIRERIFKEDEDGLHKTDIIDLPAPAAQPGLHPESLLDAKQATAHAIDYQADSENQIWYFDVHGNPTDKASAGGYYRKSLGKTADGRLVVQDYYQDSDAPQTAPFALVKDANPHNFDNDIADGKIIWYRKDGSTYAVQTFKDGKPTSRMNIYENGRLVAQSALPAGVSEADDPYNSAGDINSGMRYYYPSGHLLALEHNYTNYREEILYDPEGKPLATYQDSRDRLARWSVLDEHPEQGQALEDAYTRREQIQQMIEATAVGSADAQAASDADGEKAAATATNPLPCEAGEGGGGGVKTRAATATDCSQPTELPLPPAGEGGDGVSPQAADAKADNTTNPHPCEAGEGGGVKTRAATATDCSQPTKQPLPPVGKGGDGVSPQAADAKADNTTNPLPCEAGEGGGGGVKTRAATATDCSQPTELPLPPVGEGGDGVSAQAADAKADSATAPAAAEGKADTEKAAPAELPLPPVGEGGDGVSAQAADAKADNATAPAAVESKADAAKAAPTELPLPPVGEGGDGVSPQAADAKADNTTNPHPCEAGEGGGVKTRAATATDCSQPTELPLPPVGEGGDGVSPQASDAKTETNSDRKYNLGLSLPLDSIQPDSLQAPAAQTARLPENLLDAKQAAENPIDYTPATAPDLYADRDGKPSEQPTPGGFIRKTLGKTADGRLVVQDYYQDSGTPQTAPLTLKKGADPRDFTTAAVDGKAVWYSTAGDILAIQQYQNGAPVSRLNYYHAGRLVIQSRLPQGVSEAEDPYSSVGDASKGERYYYQNGQLLALDYDSRLDPNIRKILYDENGQPLAAWHGERSNDIVTTSSWNTLNNTPAAEQTARRQTFDAALARKAELQKLLHAESELNAPTDGDKAPSATPDSQPAPSAATPTTHNHTGDGNVAPLL